MNEHCIVVSGNPADGFHFWGPFRDTETANDWGETISDDCWWVAPLDRPETEEVTYDIIP